MALKVGDSVPHFTAISLDGSIFDSKDLLGKKPIVLYFYPKDNTPGCTAQACSFRDQYHEFKTLGAEVIGVSSDSIQAHQKFSKQYQLPFVLLSDANNQLRKLFGVPNDFFGLIPGRATYVIDQHGIIQMIFDSVSGVAHINKALQFVRKLR
jgi:peroxiredoxin Q/BCP